MSRATNRRHFMKSGVSAGIGYWVAGGVAARASDSPNERVHIAAMGVGGQGDSDSREAGNHGALVAICDIDDKRLGLKGAAFPKAKKFNDYRKMLEKMDRSIDAVTVSIPDHSHAVASLMAMRMGKACFTQKPLTHSIGEARLMGEVARETQVATQMGNQGTAEDSLREMVAIVQSGVLGTVSDVHVWTNRPVWPQGLNRPSETPPVPAHVHWDLFLGPAKSRPYHGAYHPFKWRGWWEFGTGALGDMACHTLNMPYMALELQDPVSVQAETSGHNHETYPAWSVIDFQFPERNGRAPVKLRWYDGGKLPDESLVQGEVLEKRGALIVGDKGSLYAPGDYTEKGLFLLGVDKPEVTWTKSPGHFAEWVNAIKGGPIAVSSFAEYSGPLTEVTLLGNLAVWAAPDPGVGKKIEWDAQNLKATHAPEVMHIVHKEYYNGFQI